MPAERPARDVFHRDEGNALVHQILVNSDDVGVVERARQLRLVEEPFGNLRLLRMQSPEFLQRHIALKHRLASKIDNRRAATTDLADNLVRTHRPLDRLWLLTHCRARRVLAPAPPCYAHSQAPPARTGWGSHPTVAWRWQWHEAVCAVPDSFP